MNTRFAVLTFAALLSLPLAACSSSDASEPDPGDDTEVLDPEGKADGVNKPVGTYEAGGAADLSLLVLKTDGTVNGQFAPACSSCEPEAFAGTFKFTKSTNSSRRYIKLELPNDSLRYEYKVKNGKLNLREVYTSEWFYMTQAQDAWCSVPNDCKLQNLATPRCIGAWSCDASACSYECGVPTNACETAGGSCVGLYPGACADGEVGNANDYSCGGMVGVQCCLPKKNPCEAAGGMCVGLTPGGCVNGTVGNATEYSCGGAVGVQCCLPNPNDCRQTGCAAGKYCTFCWSGYACIPEGAVC